jgi:hypothetical protein
VFGLASDVDLQTALASRDRQPLIAELADDVEGFTWRLLQREPDLVRLHGAFDLGAHVLRRLEETVGRHEAVECLMRTLEVVVADEVLESVLRICHVREDSPPQKFLPQGLPEALDLAERLRMLRPAPDVLHTEACQ